MRQLEEIGQSHCHPGANNPATSAAGFRYEGSGSSRRRHQYPSKDPAELRQVSIAEVASQGPVGEDPFLRQTPLEKAELEPQTQEKGIRDVPVRRDQHRDYGNITSEHDGMVSQGSVDVSCNIGGIDCVA